MAGGEGRNPETEQVSALGAVFQGTNLGRMLGNKPAPSEVVERPKEDLVLSWDRKPEVTEDEGDPAAAAAALTEAEGHVRSQGLATGRRPPPEGARAGTGGFARDVSGIPRASMVPPAPRGGGGAGRPVYDRGQVNWKEGAEEFRKRQARSLEYAAIENVRAAEATEDYYENVAIARRDAAAVFKGEADSMGALKDRALTESLEQAQRVQAVARKVGAFSPRPGRLFADASGAASFGAALSLAAGAMESARSGGPNVALGIINNAIKRDVAAQELELEGMKAELQAEATVFQEIRAAYGDALTAQKAQMAAEQEAAVMYLQAQMDQYMGPIKKAQLMAVAHQMQAQSNNTLIEMSERAYQTITNHKKGQVMADMKKLNIEGTWNQRDMSYDEFQQELYLRAAGEESEAASAEEQGAALAEQRLRQAQAQAEAAAAIDRPVPAPSAAAPRQRPPAPAPSTAAPTAEAAAPESAPAAPPGLTTESSASEAAARAYDIERELSRIATPSSDGSWEAMPGQDQSLVDIMAAQLASAQDAPMREGRAVPESVKRGGEINIRQQTGGRDDPRAAQWKRDLADSPELARETKDDLEGFLGGWVQASPTKSDSVEAGRLAQVASEVGSYEGVPEGSRQSAAVTWVYRAGEQETKTGYKPKAKPGIASARGLPLVALATDDSDEALRKFQQYVAGEGAPPNTKFQKAPVPMDFTIPVPVTQSDGSTKTVNVPFRGSVPGYLNTGLVQPADGTRPVVRGAQDKGMMAGVNPFNGRQKMYFKESTFAGLPAESKAKAQQATRDVLERANKLISASYAVELYEDLYGREFGPSGAAEYVFQSREVSKDNLRAALEKVPARLRQRAMMQLGLDRGSDKGEGTVNITLNALKTLAGTVSHQEGFKTPQRVELGLSQDALGAKTIESIFDLGQWMAQREGVRGLAAKAYRNKLVSEVETIMDGLQPEVDLADAIKEAKKKATRNLPKSTGRDDG
ncbi:MAG: hypothetical protein GY772_16555 [bacterium]|nr:hypothetical protein [bacterium]